MLTKYRIVTRDVGAMRNIPHAISLDSISMFRCLSKDFYRADEVDAAPKHEWVKIRDCPKLEEGVYATESGLAMIKNGAWSNENKFFDVEEVLNPHLGPIPEPKDSI